MRESIKSFIQRHYDLITPYYLKLWGEHIHHGLWLKGDETKEEAQENLIRELINLGQIQRNAKILDVGCGLGGSSIYLARHLNAEVLGITLSPIQAKMASRRVTEKKIKNVKIIVMDAENLNLPPDTVFDVVWAVESISHFPHKDKFFKKAADFLKKEGKLVLADWFQREKIKPEEREKFIEPIEHGMLTPKIEAMSNYEDLLENEGLRIIKLEDISERVSKTWDISIKYLKPFYRHIQRLTGLKTR